MPEKIIDKEGKEHEIMTQEEIDNLVNEKTSSAVEEAKKTFQTELETKISELDSLKSELDIAKESLEKAGEGTQDWAKARKMIKDLEEKVSTVEKEKNSLREEFSKEIRTTRESIFQSQIDLMLKSLASGDQEIEKKIKFRYDQLGGKEVKSETEAAEKLKDAYLLATGKQSPNPLNVARGFSGGQPPKIDSETVNQEVSELGRKLGISDQDITKYSIKAKEKKQR